MLQDIRQNIQGTFAKIIIAVIVAAFALFGIESILLSGGGSAVAEVNGEEIGPQELQQAINSQRRQLIATMGDNLDPAMLADESISQQAMQSLIQRKLLLQSAQEMGLAISDQQVGAVIATMGQFQLDGQFSPEMYRARLADIGFTPGSFKQAMVEDMLMAQVRSGLAGSDFATPAELALNARIVGEQRDLRYVTIPLSDFDIADDVSDAEVQAYYQANQQQFMSEESVALDYIELKVEDFVAPVDEQAVLDAYREEIQSSQYQTESGVSHILFEQGADESDEAFGQRIAEVQGELAEGADFAALAREASDDIGSAGAGGDLGFTRGNAFPEEMEEAIAALEVGEISSPVVTEAGTHLILLTERREGKPPSLEQIRGELEQAIALAEARVELLRAVETLKDLVFNADNLEGPAEELSLEVHRSEAVTRGEDEGLFAELALIAAAFSDDVLNAGHNSDVIELDRDHWVALRVHSHQPAEVLALAQVRDDILARVADQRARAAVAAAAAEAVKALRDGEGVEALATAAGYQWQVELGVDRSNETLPLAVLEGAFSVAPPAEGEAVADYVTNPAGDALVFEVSAVRAGSMDSLPKEEQAVLQQLVAGEYSQIVDSEYRQRLRDSADINVM